MAHALSGIRSAVSSLKDEMVSRGIAREHEIANVERVLERTSRDN
jgi:hypothetical protein